MSDDKQDTWAIVEIPRTCILCEHFDFDGGEPDYSEYTPGANWSCECIKGHFLMSGLGVNHADFREALLQAVDCADFQFSQFLRKKLRSSK